MGAGKEMGMTTSKHFMWYLAEAQYSKGVLGNTSYHFLHVNIYLYGGMVSAYLDGNGKHWRYTIAPKDAFYYGHMFN